MRARLAWLAVLVMLGPGVAEAQVQPAALNLSLADAVSRGLEFNLTAILEDQQRRIASGARLQALAALMPRVSGNVRESAQIINTAAFGFSGLGGLPNLIGPFTVFDARLAVSAPIVDPAATAELRIARANEHAAEADFRRVRETVVLAVGNVYLQALSDRARVDAARSQVSTAEALLRLATDQNASGVVARIDVLRQQVQLENARALLIASENDFAKRKLQLARAIGLTATQSFELSDTVSFTPAPEMTIEDAVREAASHREDLKAAHLRLDAARAARGAAFASHLPSLRLDADLGVLGLTASTAEKTYTIAAALHVPIFDGGRSRAQTVVADAAIRQREAELADLDRGVRFDVSAALLDVNAAAAAVNVAKSGEDLAREELTQAEDRFRAGVATSIELAQAQDAVAHATEQYIASVYSHNLAKATLARALGEGETRFLPLVGGRP